MFGKTDSYFLASDENVISVLGKDADSAFYGLTTLYHVFAQMDSLTIRNFEIEDYADVVAVVLLKAIMEIRGLQKIV